MGALLKHERIKEVEDQFRKIRWDLDEECLFLCNAIHLFKLIEQRKSDRLREINQAPAFFQMAQKGLLTSIVLWGHKLLVERDSAIGFHSYIRFVESNLGLFSVEHLKKRVQNPAGSWVENRKSLGEPDIERCKLKIEGLGGLINSLRVRRDKYEAHFDGKYKRDFSLLANDSPITWGDLDSVVEVVHDVFNEFSIAFDGSEHGLQAGNIDDVNWLLEIVHRYLHLRNGGMEEL